MARPASSWIDDYIDWLKVASCCKINSTDGTFCPSNIRDPVCIPCERFLMADGVRPTVETYNKFLTYFLSDLPDPNCSKAGRAAYVKAVNYLYDNYGSLDVKDTYYMSYHTTCVTSKDFYTSLEQARVLADDIEATFQSYDLDLKVFPYRYIQHSKDEVFSWKN